MELDWTTLITALASGTGGGLLGVIINNRTAERTHQKQAERQAALDLRNAELEAQAKEVALLTAKDGARRSVDAAVEKLLERHQLEFTRLGTRIDEEMSAREGQAKRNDELVAEMRALYAELTGVQEQLAATKTALALAEAEADRKESVIVKLQRRVAELEELTERLQTQLAECKERGKEADELLS